VIAGVKDPEKRKELVYEVLSEAIPVPDPDVRPTETVPVGEPPSPIARRPAAGFAPAARGRTSDAATRFRNCVSWRRPNSWLAITP
jgi:hypothetical protein